MKYNLKIIFGYVLMIVVVAALLNAVTLLFPWKASADDFLYTPRDRPVLETVQQVLQARTTGVSVFNIGGDHFVIENLPKEYVDYSSWFCRMP